MVQLDEESVAWFLIDTLEECAHEYRIEEIKKSLLDEVYGKITLNKWTNLLQIIDIVIYSPSYLLPTLMSISIHQHGSLYSSIWCYSILYQLLLQNVLLMIFLMYKNVVSCRPSHDHLHSHDLMWSDGRFSITKDKKITKKKKGRKRKQDQKINLTTGIDRNNLTCFVKYSVCKTKRA